jgi:hypothetical protein
MAWFEDKYKVSDVQNNTKTTASGVTRGVVKKVYLDFSTQPNGRTIIPGAIEVEAISRTKSTTLIAYPYDEQFLDIPCITELVDIYTEGTLPTYKRINYNKTINNSQTAPGTPGSSTPKTGLDSFKSLGGIVNALAGAGGSMGDYFSKQKINRLKVFEGDTLIQSRFGQSIRLSGYNTKGNKFAPTFTIRNKQSDKKGLFGSSEDTILEDLNSDGSTILLSSGDNNNINFIPGTPNALGGSDFKTRPDKSARFIYIGKDDDYGFEAFPTQYNGEQCFISSDRLVFSSRKNEMIFWSKGNYGIITDGIFTVDTDKGININSGNHIDIQAFNKQINFFIGDAGEINIGNKNLSAAVDGQGLVLVLLRLIDLISSLSNGGLYTPAGPTSGINPVLKTELDNIQDKVNTLLSSHVKIQI